MPVLLRIGLLPTALARRMLVLLLLLALLPCCCYN